MNIHKRYMREAIKLSRMMMRKNQGGPFGAIIVRRGKIIARGWNQVTSANDPTAHAEVVAIRNACDKIGAFQLTGCVLYTSCEPCPMCLAAIYWARPDAIYYANTKKDAARIAFDDDFIYQEIMKPKSRKKIPMRQILRAEALTVFKEWELKPDKIQY